MFDAKQSEAFTQIANQRGLIWREKVQLIEMPWFIAVQMQPA